MENPARLVPVLAYLEKAREGTPGMSTQTLKEAADDLIQALNRTFNIPREKAFRLRMSNIGKPYCQLWMEKNKPLEGIPPTAADMIKFTIGDLTEVVVKAILKEVFKEEYTDACKHELEIAGLHIRGSSDLIISGKVDDVKSASDWSFEKKFKDVWSLVEGDHFGYIAQLVAYAKAEENEIGGWWVVNKTTGALKYVEASEVSPEQADHIWKDIVEKVRKINENAPFEKVFEDEEETFNRKPTGNRILPKHTPCRYCPFRYTCWPDLVEISSLVSQAKTKRKEYYTFVTPQVENDEEVENETRVPDVRKT